MTSNASVGCHHTQAFDVIYVCLLSKVFTMDVKVFSMDVKVFSMDVNCSVIYLDLLVSLFVIKCEIKCHCVSLCLCS